MAVLVFLHVSAVSPFVHAQGADAENRLEKAISNFKDGEYKKAADSIAPLLPFLAGTELREGYKYYGFCLAMLNRVEEAKAAFATALDKFPEMEIDTLEVQPTITIVFKQAKLEKTLAAMDTAIKKKPTVIIEKKNVALPVTLLVCGIVSAGASANLFYFGYQDMQKYNAIATPDAASLDHYYNAYRNLYIGGGITAGIAAVLVPVSIVLFAKKEHVPRNVSLASQPGGARLVVLIPRLP